MSGLDHHLVRRGLDVARHAGSLVDRGTIDTATKSNNTTPHTPSKDLTDIFNPLKSGNAAFIFIVSAVLLALLVVGVCKQ